MVRLNSYMITNIEILILPECNVEIKTVGYEGTSRYRKYDSNIPMFRYNIFLDSLIL